MQQVLISCDYCGTELQSPHDARYELRMEAKLIGHPAANDDTALEHEPLDPLDAMEDYLAESEETLDDSAELAQPVLPLDQTFDLCAACYARIQSDPLGLDGVRRLEFHGR